MYDTELEGNKDLPIKIYTFLLKSNREFKKDDKGC